MGETDVWWWNQLSIQQLTFDRDGFAFTGVRGGYTPLTVWVPFERVNRFVLAQEDPPGSQKDGFVWCVSMGKSLPAGDKTSPDAITFCTQDETLTRKVFDALFTLVAQNSKNIPDFFFPGIVWEGGTGRCQIYRVLEGGPAAAAGLAKGDVVLAANDAAVAPGLWPHCQEAFWQQFSGRATLTLTVKASRNGSEFATQMTVRNPFAGGAAPQSGREAWLGKIVLDPKLPGETQRNFERAIAAVDALITRYGLRTPSPVTIIVTADTEGYIQALMTYAGFTRQEAEKVAINKVVRLGGSLSQTPVIFIRWIPTRVLRKDGTSYEVNNPEDVFFSLPHEVFHQVQRSFRLKNMPIWLSEGPATVFQYLAIDSAGVKTFADMYEKVKDSVLNSGHLDVAVISRITDQEQWSALTDKAMPTYAMAHLMAARLLGDKNFDKISAFYRRVDQGIDIDSAFAATFGMTIPAFEKSMNDYIRESHAKRGSRAR